MHHCCIASKFSWVTFPSGRSNPLMSVRMFLGREQGGCPGRSRPGGLPGGGVGLEGHSLSEAVVEALGGAEADDGVDYGGRVHGREAVDDRHDHRVHLAVVAADKGGWVTAGRGLGVRAPGRMARGRNPAPATRGPSPSPALKASGSRSCPPHHLTRHLCCSPEPGEPQIPESSLHPPR